ncbi:DBH-like monooxygenase protein 1 [Lepeophtheirus salmonis]|uniref:DBH-like monooxygenase protein 1 n=1 Tax=Lepeophtheirus salmonis TaxID=72036 RepID=UPI001AE543AC|nr:DBH-like monooxygenase protein 1 [Lepeophtheirus salmonis]
MFDQELFYVSILLCILTLVSSKSTGLDYSDLTDGSSNPENEDNITVVNLPNQVSDHRSLMEEWKGEHWAALDSDLNQVFLSWNIEHGDSITFQIEVHSTGWLSLAFSFRGELDGADVVYMWVEDRTGIARLVDAHGTTDYERKFETNGTRFRVDSEPNYEIIIGYQYQDTTVIRFSRKINTCDEDDVIITNDTFTVLWSYSHKDPPYFIDDKIDLDILKADRFGSRSLHLYESPGSRNKAPQEDTYNWLLSSKALVVPAQSTLYWCTVMRLPDFDGEKYHMIGYYPFITPGNERFVHHMMIYECHSDEVYDVDTGYECNTPNMPNNFKKCKGIIAAWGLGGEPFYFPEDVGYPLGQNYGGSTYYMFEIHYDNPGHYRHLVDSSGIELVLTPKLRKYDSSLMTIGHDVSSLHIIPPGEKKYVSVAHCPDLCTRLLPEDGIKVFAGLAHTHDLGRSVRLRHLRNGAEMPVPFQDRFFNPNYQTMRRIDMEVKPNDHLITECSYNSSSLTHFTRGGFSRKEEMCLIFLHYYPATKLAHCASRLSFKHVLYALGVTVWPITPQNKHLGLRIKDPAHMQNLTFGDYLKISGRNDPIVSSRLQDASLHHSHKAECFDYGRQNVYADGLEFSTPRIYNPIYDYLEDDVCHPQQKIYSFDEQETFSEDNGQQPLHSSSSHHLISLVIYYQTLLISFHLSYHSIDYHYNSL